MRRENLKKTLRPRRLRGAESKIPPLRRGVRRENLKKLCALSASAVQKQNPTYQCSPSELIYSEFGRSLTKQFTYVYYTITLRSSDDCLTIAQRDGKTLDKCARLC